VSGNPARQDELVTSRSDQNYDRPPTGTLLDDPSLVGAALSRAWTAMIDDWIRQVDAEAQWAGRWGLAAVGGYGRAVLCPGSDLDLVLFHDGSASVDELAKRIWYPLWDSGLKIGHSVRRPEEALALAADDLDTATSLLDVRVILGDSEFIDDIAARAREQWRRRADDLLPRLVERTRQRHATMGVVAFLLEPDIKMAQGGLRDIHTLRWLDAALPTLADSERAALIGPHDTLLSVRAELHRLSGRGNDELHLQDQDGVAAALGYADADELMAAIATASRTIEWISGAALHRRSRPRPRRRFLRAGRTERTNVGGGMFIAGGTLQLEDGAPVESDPVMALRVALAAAEHGAFIGRDTLDRLAESPARLSDPWPDDARETLVAILLTGRPAIAVLEALDQVDLITRVLPEWAPNRNRPQRNAYHRFTVDRHLLETAAEAAALTDRVDRPDLLVLGALFHDIGKGYPGDHSQVGLELVETIATRMGMPSDDVEVLASLVKHHLLLPDVASRRDLEDVRTTRFVAGTVGSVGTLRLLGALTEADGIATGPSAWGGWKSDLVHSLVERTTMVLEGKVAQALTPDFPSAHHRRLLDAEQQTVVLEGRELTVVALNRPGVFSRVAGALALHGVKIIDAVLHTEGRMALDVLRVRGIALEERPDQIVADVESALAGRLALQARLYERARTYGTGRALTARPVEPEVSCDNRFAESATVVDVRCPDSIGLLYRISRAMVELDIDIVSAKVQILGADIYGAFYVQEQTGHKVLDPDHISELELAVMSAMTTSLAATEGGRIETSQR
jgi:[protein-PII] uridylyltransferase